MQRQVSKLSPLQLYFTNDSSRNEIVEDGNAAGEHQTLNLASPMIRKSKRICRIHTPTFSYLACSDNSNSNCTTNYTPPPTTTTSTTTSTVTTTNTSPSFQSVESIFRPRLLSCAPAEYVHVFLPHIINKSKMPNAPSPINLGVHDINKNFETMKDDNTFLSLSPQSLVSVSDTDVSDDGACSATALGDVIPRQLSLTDFSASLGERLVMSPVTRNLLQENSTISLSPPSLPRHCLFD